MLNIHAKCRAQPLQLYFGIVCTIGMWIDIICWIIYLVSCLRNRFYDVNSVEALHKSLIPMAASLAFLLDLVET